jgi:hypothetical protein
MTGKAGGAMLYAEIFRDLTPPPKNIMRSRSNSPSIDQIFPHFDRSFHRKQHSRSRPRIRTNKSIANDSSLIDRQKKSGVSPDINISTEFNVGNTVSSRIY